MSLFWASLYWVSLFWVKFCSVEPNVSVFNIIILSVVNAERYFAKCLSAEWRGATKRSGLMCLFLFWLGKMSEIKINWCWQKDAIRTKLKWTSTFRFKKPGKVQEPKLKSISHRKRIVSESQYNKTFDRCNNGKSAASFCCKVATWFPDMLCKFYSVKNC